MKIAAASSRLCCCDSEKHQIVTAAHFHEQSSLLQSAHYHPRPHSQQEAHTTPTRCASSYRQNLPETSCPLDRCVQHKEQTLECAFALTRTCKQKHAAVSLVPDPYTCQSIFPTSPGMHSDCFSDISCASKIHHHERILTATAAPRIQPGSTRTTLFSAHAFNHFTTRRSTEH